MSIPFDPPGAGVNAFRNMFGSEISPLGSAGNSHFGYVNPLASDAYSGWHVTTDVPGLKVGTKISVHDFLSDFNK